MNEAVDLTLPHEGGEDGGPDALVVKVIAAQVGDGSHHAGLDDRDARDVGGDGHGQGDDATEVGDEALCTCHGDVLVDEGVDGLFDVTVVLGEGLASGLTRSRQRRGTVDGESQDAAQHRDGRAGCHVGCLSQQGLADVASDSHEGLLSINSPQG